MPSAGNHSDRNTRHLAKYLDIRWNALPVLFPHMNFTVERRLELPRLRQLFEPFWPWRGKTGHGLFVGEFPDDGRKQQDPTYKSR